MRHKLGVGRPLLIIGFSMGGIVAKRLILRTGKDLNLKGVMYIGVPHAGSEAVNETIREVNEGYSGFTTFETTGAHSVTKDEFIE